MSSFLIIIAVLTVGQMYFEFKIVKALHLESFNRRFVIGNLVFSICMSIGFGLLFPAAGMTIAAAGLLSTILSQPMYEFYDMWQKHMLPTLREGKQNILAKREDIEQGWKTFVRCCVILIRLITLPFRILAWLLQAGDNIQKAIHNVRHH